MKAPVPLPRARRRRCWSAGRLAVFAVLLGVVLHAGWHLRFGLPVAPLADEDVWGYLAPPIFKLTGGSFEHSFSREWPYPAFLLANLFCFNSFYAVTRFQHVLGLLSGGLLWLAWRELTGLTRAPRGFALRELAAWGSGILGLGLVAVYLLARRTVLFEHTLRPEAVFPFFGALHLWLTLGFVRRRWRVPTRRNAAVRWGAAALFVTCVLLMVRPAFGFAAAFANLPVLAALLARDTSWAERLRLAGVPLALGVIILFVPERMLAARDRVATIMMPAARLAIHADLVRAQIAEDLARPTLPPRYDRAWLERLKAQLDHSFAASAEPAHRWTSLGFNPDYMLAVERFWEGCFPDNAEGDHALAAFCNYYYFRSLEHHPGAMLARIGHELTYFYRFDASRLRWRFLGSTVDPYSRQEQVSLSADAYYPRTVRSLDVAALRARADRSDAFRSYLASCQRREKSKTAGRLGQPKAVGIMDNLVRATYLPMLVLALAAALAVAVHRGWRTRAGWVAAVTPVLFTYNFGMCLTVAAVQTLGTARYIENQEVFTVFAWFGGLWMIVSFLAGALLGNDGAFGMNIGPRHAPEAMTPT